MIGVEMATVLDRVPVGDIEAEVSKVEPGRVLMTVLLGVLFVLGWLVGAMVRTIAWSIAAAKVGYRAGRAKPLPDGGG